MRGRRFADRLGVRASVAVLGAAVLLAWPGSARAAVHDYYGPYAWGFYGVEEASGWNNPDRNRVYRPLGYYYTIYYTDDYTAWGYKRNYWDNPLVWPYAGGYAKSACIHSDHYYTDPQWPVSCQYIT
jgi:hypothetical protein